MTIFKWWEASLEETMMRMELVRRFMSQYSAKQQRKMLDDAGRAMATGILEGIEQVQREQKAKDHGNH